MRDLSFREKSLWLMIVSLVIAFGFYFTNALRAHFALARRGEAGALTVTAAQVGLFVVAVVLSVVLAVLGHVLIAIIDRRGETDERDRLISLKGERNGSFVLATGVFCSLCLAVFTPGNFVFTHVLLAFWVLAQLVEYGSQLVLYRRGA
jgi:hypothetical protein